MNKVELFLQNECVITPAMKCTASEVWISYLPYQLLKKTKGPRTPNGLISALEKLGIRFDFGTVYGLGLKNLKSETKILESKHPPNGSKIDMGRFVKIDREKYGVYLASREWWVRRQAVMRRAKGMCERCKKNRATAVHHLTYARIYKELLTDLQAICQGCHDFNHALSDIDPAKQ